MPKTLVSCHECNKEFKKENSQITLTNRNFCSLVCSGKAISRERYLLNSQFGYYLTSSKKRSKVKNLECDLTLEFLDSLYKSQQGLCKLTKIPMILNHRSKTKEDKSLYYASLDRIDNKLGYIKTNIQFVCLGINYLRNSLSLSEAIDFIQKIKNT